MIDLDLRSSRLDKEQQKRRDEAKKKRDREVALQREQVRREQELAQRAAQKREEDERAEMARQIAEIEEQRITGGIKFSHSLKVYQIEGEDDKVILSEDCLTELTQQDAFTRGAMTFQLSTIDESGITHITHCGVREFSAPAGTIGIPPKVRDSLGLPMELVGDETAQIKYVLLPKCTFAKLQPKQNNFIEVGPVKMCLEENLRFHTALTVGDVLTVWYRGKAHALCVTEMKPDSKGSLIDTDVEVDLELSEEFLRHQAEENKSAQFLGKSTGAAAGASAGVSVPVTTAAGAGSSSGSTASSGRSTPSSVFHTLGAVSGPSASGGVSSGLAAESLAALRAQLLPEPDASSKECITLKIKLPSGVTKTRRFLHASAVAQVFLYVAMECATDAVTPEEVLTRVQLSTRFPPRALKLGDVCAVGAGGAAFSEGKSFVDIGLNVPSEAIFASML